MELNEKDILHKYQNGNVEVTIYQNGTQVLEYPDDEIPNYEFPTSMDIHITNRCSIGCKFCHECSTPQGKHGDLNKLSEILSVLPKGVEIAIGGGNIFEHSELTNFLIRCKDQDIISNITVNQKQLKNDFVKIRNLIENKLVYGVGLSITDVDNLKTDEYWLACYEHTVCHLILGVHTVGDILRLKDFGFKKFLLLGYKEFGRGVDYYQKNKENIDKNIKNWKDNISLLLLKSGCIISFDNLAIDQINLENKLSKKIWNEQFMGEDFNHTMYIDAVEEEFAPTSRSPKTERVKWDDVDFLEYFQKNRNK